MNLQPEQLLRQLKVLQLQKKEIDMTFSLRGLEKLHFQEMVMAELH